MELGTRGGVAPSAARPIDSGLRLTNNKASGTSPARIAAPTANQAVRQPLDCTTEPTTGNAIMNPTLSTTL